MALSARAIRAQLNILKPLLDGCSLKTAPKGQDKLGELMEARQKDHVLIKRRDFDSFSAAWVIPRDERRQSVILYLHGGGYTCGGLEYALGFGSTLSFKTGSRVFCPAYRLAPEHPFPAAVDDALESYLYLLDRGYRPERIALCGESAGGGLCYSLCLKLKALSMPLPGGIIALSPWTDLTASGSSYRDAADSDPVMTGRRLDFFARCYTDDRENPLASPLFGDMSAMPPSLLFVGNDEIMRSDTVSLHKKLLDAHRPSHLVVTPERWHAYLLYGIREDEKDFDTIGAFLNKYICQEYKLRWLRLDNAGKIYPAARRQNWSNVFRLSATLTEPVDAALLQSALDVTVRRFPSIATRLRRGVFWYYLEQLAHAPAVSPEYSYPLTRMDPGALRRCAFRVIVYDRRIAVEMFHALTDGTGALIFLKSLVAEYLEQKYAISIPATHGVLSRLEAPSEEELEDSFLRYAGDVAASRKENTAWHLSGTPEEGSFLHVTCMTAPVQAVVDKAHEYGITVTAFLCAAMMQALQQLQQLHVPDQKKRKPIKVLLPVNLRRLFPSRTLRNFALYTTPELLPRLGSYSFADICRIVTCCMGSDVTAKQMSMKIASNVVSERLLAVKLMPLFIKNAVMKAVFDTVGERKSCLSLSNLGNVQIPAEMARYVTRFDFILGVQAAAPYNCGVLSYRNDMQINFIRNIREPLLEQSFFRVLQTLGIPVTIQSNDHDR